MSWMRFAGRVIVLALAGLLLLATLLPLLPGDAWWLRVPAFPRPQVAALLVVCLAAAALLFRSVRRPGVLALLIALGVALLQQLWLIRPYTPLHPAQVPAMTECPEAQRLSVLVANLRADGGGARRFLDLARRLQPDLVLATELDTAAARSLHPLLEGDWPHRLLSPRESFWGIGLYSRLPLPRAEIRHLVEGYVPSVHAEVRLRSGEVVGFLGLHPKPPVPFGHGTALRDAELALAALEVAAAGRRPAVVAGDLNAVAWSRITGLLQRTGGLLDPRIGRGLYATFPAWLPGPLRWPLDYVFATGEFRLLAMEVGPPLVSDHLPLLIRLCRAPGPPVPAPAPRPGDAEAVRAVIRAGCEAAAAKPEPQRAEARGG